MQEWLDALESVIHHSGPERADQLLLKMAQRVALEGQLPSYNLTTPFRNTISLAQETPFPGDFFLERRIRAINRWNALMIVMRANTAEPSLGGHISSYASCATLYEIGFNHFFHADDLIYFQGHVSPGIYARSFLEGHFQEEDLDRFRREISGGLSSYPHPWLMPDYWQFPTVSMGLGPIQGIYQAYIMRYLQARSLIEPSDRKVWVFCGDGEMDEPESLGAISMAGRENLDNLIFVINCNLQRLDGPVRGNGQIIQELEGVFRGAGWNVIKAIWGRHWDPLFAADRSGQLQTLMDETVDGEYQNLSAQDVSYIRKFFARTPETQDLADRLSDAEIAKLNRGGHDPHKIYAAYAAATKQKSAPTVILAFTIKGYGMGQFEAENQTHQAKKLNMEDLKQFRDRFNLPIPDSKLADMPYYRPSQDSPEYRYLMERRELLGGCMPRRRNTRFESFKSANQDHFSPLKAGSGKRSYSTTMAFVRILNSLLKEPVFGASVVPIVPDEARTFGMEAMFRSIGIYSAQGQLYEPHDAGDLAPYKESRDGIMLEEGITEAGSFSAWLALATAYSNYNKPMLPFYIFYSMFGFQRIHDLAWAAGDSQARGFLIGATSGRTTLNGEGLQHQDGHSHTLATTIPNCISYDPAYAGELAVIIENGIERMYRRQDKVFYYITVNNENYHQPALSKQPEQAKQIEEGIIKGLYLFRAAKSKTPLRVRLIGAGAIMNEVLKAGELLEAQNIGCDIFSATSLTELRREALEKERMNQLNPMRPPEQPWVHQILEQGQGPVIAATDYIKALPDGIRQWVPADYSVLGTDGFGRSDTRPSLRSFFEVDCPHIAAAAFSALARTGQISAEKAEQAIKDLGIKRPDTPPEHN